MRGRCSVSTNSPPVKSSSGRRQQDRRLQRKHVFAVEILVQAIVVAGAVLQQQRRRARLARLMAARRGTPHARRDSASSIPMRLVPAIGDRRERRIERRAQDRRPDRAADRRNICIRPCPKPCRAMTTWLRKRLSSDRARRALGIPPASAAFEHADAAGRRGRRRSRPSRCARSRSARRDIPPRRFDVGRRSCRRLPRQQRALALDAPAVARERAVVAHHAVAGDRHRERVGARRPAPPRAPLRARRCARRSRHSSRSRPPGSPAAPARRAAGTRCRARSSGRSSPSAGASTKPTTLRDQRSNSASPPISCACGKRSCRSRAKRRDRRRAGSRRRPASLLGDQDRAERAFADREADLGVRAAGAIGASASCRAPDRRLRRSGRWS